MAAEEQNEEPGGFHLAPELLGVFRAGRYLIVGISTFIIDLAIVLFLTNVFHMYYLAAVAVGFIIGVSINYAISRSWVFKGTARPLYHGYFYFILGGSMSLGVILLLVGFLVGGTGMPLIPARIVASSLVGAGNYLFNLYLNFKVAGKH